MAGKSRRVASRQAQLTRRKKRPQRGPSGIPATGGPAAGVVEETGADVSAGPLAGGASQPDEAAVATAAPVAAAPAATRSPSRAPSRSPSRSRDERPAAYTYMGPEIRRILIMASIGFAVLIVLTFVR